MDPSVVPEIIHHLADTRGMARLALVTHLGTMGSVCVDELITSLKTSPNPVIRRSSAKALAKIGDSSATKPLIHSLIHDEDTVTRSSAAGALAKMGQSAIDDLLKIIADPTISMTAKGHAAWAISFMQTGAEELSKMLKAPQSDVRIAVVNALGAIAIGDALPVMGGLANDEWDDSPEEGEAKARAVNTLLLALDDKDAGVRAEVTTALANAGVKRVAPRIAEFLKDEDAELRRCAALSLMKLRDVSVLPLLRQCASDENEVEHVKSVAKLAADSLERRVKEEEDDDDDGWDD